MKSICPTITLSNPELSIKEYFECEKRVDILLPRSSAIRAETALIEALLAADRLIHGGKR